MTPRSVAQRTADAADTLDRWLQQQRPDGASTGGQPAGPLADPALSSRDADAEAGQAGRGGGEPGGLTAEPSGTASQRLLSPRHTDWLHHRLTVSGPAAAVTAFRAAAIGAGTLPWALDLDRMEEDLFHTLVAPRPPQRRRLSLAGARALARQLREAAEQRHVLAAARIGRSRACPFDLHALVPVPDAVLRLGLDQPDALAWLWAHWGTTQALRHVAEDRVAALGRHPVRRRPRPPPGAAPRSRRPASQLLVGRLDAVAGAGPGDPALAHPALRHPPHLRPAVTEAAADADPSHPCPAPPVGEDPPHRLASATSPILAVDGFEGPLDWLLAMARSRKIDLAQLSILALVEAFAGAMETALRRAPDAPAPDLARWATWTVMAAQLTELRSRLLRPADAPAARTALAEAEALRRHWVLRTQMAAAADWLERRPQLGCQVFARGRPEAGQGAWPAGARVGHDTEDGPTQDAAAAAVHTRDSEPVEGGDITDLLRACLVALHLPPHAEADPPRRQPFWSISDAAHRIIQLLETGPEGAALDTFLAEIAEAGANRALHVRAAVAATLAAALELSRNGALTLQQDAPWQPIRVQRQDGGACDTLSEPTEKDNPALA